MFIATNSPIVLTDVLDENVLFFNFSANENIYCSKRKTFAGNIIEVISRYKVSGIGAEVSSQVVSSIIERCNQNKNVPKEDIDSIGDEFIYGYLLTRNKENLLWKRKDFGK